MFESYVNSQVPDRTYMSFEHVFQVFTLPKTRYLYASFNKLPPRYHWVTFALPERFDLTFSNILQG